VCKNLAESVRHYYIWIPTTSPGAIIHAFQDTNSDSLIILGALKPTMTQRCISHYSHQEDCCNVHWNCPHSAKLNSFLCHSKQ